MKIQKTTPFCQKDYNYIDNLIDKLPMFEPKKKPEDEKIEVAFGKIRCDPVHAVNGKELINLFWPKNRHFVRFYGRNRVII